MSSFEDPYIPRMANLGHSNSSDASGLSGITEAAESFSNSLKQLGLTTNIFLANKNLKELKDSGIPDTEVQARKTQIGNQLTNQMVAGGFPATQIRAVQQNFLPQQNDYTSVTDLFTRGKPEEIQKYIQNEGALKRETAKIPDPAVQAFKEAKKDEQDYQFKVKTLTGLRKATNEAETSSRNTMGVLAQKANTLTDLNGLIGDPSGWNAKTNFHIQELVTGLDRVFKGGVATETGTAGLMPHDLEMKIAALKQYASSEPTAANQANFIKLYNDAIQRTGQIVEAQLSGYKKATLSAIPSVAKKYGDDFPELTRNMLGGESGAYDEKSKRVVFENDAEDAKIGQKINDLSKAKLDPDLTAKILQGIESEPRYWDAVMRDKRLVGKLRMIKGKLGYGGQ